MASKGLSRRDLLLLGGTALVALSIPASIAYLGAKGEDEIEASLLSLLADQPGAAEIGRQWQAKTGGSMNARNVALRIAKRLHAHGWRPGVEADVAHKALAARVRKDFAQNDVVDIEGWHLSRTSAELCLLAHLQQDGGATHA